MDPVICLIQITKKLGEKLALSPHFFFLTLRAEDPNQTVPVFAMIPVHLDDEWKRE